MYKCYRNYDSELLIHQKKISFLLHCFRRSSIGTFIRSHPSSDSSATSSQSNKPQKPQAPKLDYRSMVSIDDMPALFVSFDSKYYFVFPLKIATSSCLYVIFVIRFFFSFNFFFRFLKILFKNVKIFLNNFLFEDIRKLYR